MAQLPNAVLAGISSDITCLYVENNYFCLFISPLNINKYKGLKVM
jgi:hypothetical protein